MIATAAFRKVIPQTVEVLLHLIDIEENISHLLVAHQGNHLPVGECGYLCLEWREFVPPELREVGFTAEDQQNLREALKSLIEWHESYESLAAALQEKFARKREPLTVTEQLLLCLLKARHHPARMAMRCHGVDVPLAQIDHIACLNGKLSVLLKNAKVLAMTLECDKNLPCPT